MSNAIEIAKAYFELSNKSDLAAIEELMTESTTYSSTRAGVYLGKAQIMEMQRAFHSSFESLIWDVLSVREVRPGVIHFDFVFKGKRDGERINKPGDEYVIVFDGKLQHIEVRDK